MIIQSKCCIYIHAYMFKAYTCITSIIYIYTMPNYCLFCLRAQNVTHSLHLIVASTVPTIAFPNLPLVVVPLHFKDITRWFDTQIAAGSSCQAGPLGDGCAVACDTQWSDRQSLQKDGGSIHPQKTNECHMSPKKGAILKGKVAGSKHYFFEPNMFGLDFPFAEFWGLGDVQMLRFKIWDSDMFIVKSKSYHHLTHGKSHANMYLKKICVNCHDSMMVISSNWISCYRFSSLVGEDDFMFGLRFPNPFGEKNETKVPFVEAHGQGWP